MCGQQGWYLPFRRNGNWTVFVADMSHINPFTFTTSSFNHYHTFGHRWHSIRDNLGLSLSLCTAELQRLGLNHPFFVDNRAAPEPQSSFECSWLCREPVQAQQPRGPLIFLFMLHADKFVCVLLCQNRIQKHVFMLPSPCHITGGSHRGWLRVSSIQLSR